MTKYKMKILAFFFIIGFAFNVQAQQEHSYLDNVGDISYNSNTDKSTFSLTGKKIMQYYNFFPSAAIKGEKPYLVNFFKNRYKPISCDDSGYITIRFVVNYLGETDRFRIEQMDLSYQNKEFDKKIKSQLIEITKELSNWKIAEKEGQKYDYYQYLTFIIEYGMIKEILP